MGKRQLEGLVHSGSRGLGEFVLRDQVGDVRRDSKHVRATSRKWQVRRCPNSAGRLVAIATTATGISDFTLQPV